MSDSLTVMVAPTWPGAFTRVTKRSPSGEIQSKLVFQPRTPYTLSGDDLEAIRGDIGKALVIVEPDLKGRPRVDTEATDRVAGAAAKKNGKRRKAAAGSGDLVGAT